MEEYTSRLEQKIALETRNFKVMADAMPQIVWTATPEGNTDYFNKRWYDYTGAKAGGDLTDPFGQQILHPDDTERTVQMWRRCVKTGEPFEVEYRLRDHASGQYRWFLGRALPGYDDKGQIVKWFGTSTDINESKEAQQQKDEFIAIASHELKTPVTSIKAFTQLVQRKLERGGNAELAGHLAKMDGQVDKLNMLISELLDVSKIDSGKLDLNLERFDVDGFIREVVENQQMVSPRHQIQIEGEAKSQIWADKNRLEQALVNLVSNGIKYSPHSDRLVIRVCRGEGEVNIGVQDFGLGIDPAQQPQIFERFFRVKGAGRETFAGLGLGLYIASEIVKRHGGRLWVESDGKSGSTFYMTLPTKKELA
jgi:PAS domain S-box-containing protein